MLTEYNLLTQKLLAEGYSEEHYPEYVDIDSSKLPGSDPLNNFSGGFIYKKQYRNQLVYQTGCGLHVLGSHVLSNMSYMGVDWGHENDCPVIRCPYDIADCRGNDKRLHGIMGGGLCIQCFCACHQTREAYCYENSYEKEEKKRQAEIERQYQEYADAHAGRVCRTHMYYNERTKSWNQHYEPALCVRVCGQPGRYCPIFGKNLDKKRGNVYYDIKTSGIRKDGTLFDGEPWVHVEKGRRFFEHPVSMDICRAFIKVQSDSIFEKFKWEKLSYMQMFDKTYQLEILNIRAESRPSRDLMLDLEDIQNGIQIIHASDLEKKAKAEKKIRRQKAREKRVKKLEERIIKIGYENLEVWSLDKIHADKWLTAERLKELAFMREQKRKEEAERPVQIAMEFTRD